MRDLVYNTNQEKCLGLSTLFWDVCHCKDSVDGHRSLKKSHTRAAVSNEQHICIYTLIYILENISQDQCIVM